MSRTIIRLAPLAALLLGACASDTPNFFQTASLTPTASAVEEATPSRASKVSAECSTLASQIESLRKDGTIERLEKVAAGKGDNVQVKRTAIARQAELNKANVDFQAKCGPRLPAGQQAAVSPMVPAAAALAVPVATAAAPVVKASAAAKAAATAAQPSGVTVAPSAAQAQVPKQ